MPYYRQKCVPACAAFNVCLIFTTMQFGTESRCPDLAGNGSIVTPNTFLVGKNALFFSFYTWWMIFSYNLCMFSISSPSYRRFLFFFDKIAFSCSKGSPKSDEVDHIRGSLCEIICWYMCDQVIWRYKWVIHAILVLYILFCVYGSEIKPTYLGKIFWINLTFIYVYT